ncbi:hypothetical protein J6S88_02785 [bacterium]|nr:hypothetical protein [bacterium]
MSVQSVNVQSGSYNPQVTGIDKKKAEDLILMLPDQVVYKLAEDQARKQIKDKSKRVMLGFGLGAIPLVYGLTGAIGARGKNLAEVFSAQSGGLVNRFINSTCQELKGPAAKFVAGAGVTAKIGGAIAIGLGAIGLVRGLFNIGKKGKEFSQQHPGTVFLAEMAALFAGTAFIPKALGGMFANMKPEKIAKMASKITKWGENFNGKNFVKSVQNLWHGTLAKSPNWLKKTGKFGVAIAPPLFIAGIIIGSIRHSMKYSKAFAENVNVIRKEQERILEERQKTANPSEVQAA